MEPHAHGEIAAAIAGIGAAVVHRDGRIQRARQHGEELLVLCVHIGDLQLGIALHAAEGLHAQVRIRDLLGGGDGAQHPLAHRAAEQRQAEPHDHHDRQHAQGRQEVARLPGRHELIDEVDREREQEQHPKERGVRKGQAPVLRGERRPEHQEHGQRDRAAVDVLQDAVGRALARGLRRAEVVEEAGEDRVAQPQHAGVENARAIAHGFLQGEVADGAEGEKGRHGRGRKVQAVVEHRAQVPGVEDGRDGFEHGAGQHADEARKEQHNARDDERGKPRARGRDADERAAHDQRRTGGEVQELVRNVGQVDGPAAERVDQAGAKEREDNRPNQVRQHREHPGDVEALPRQRQRVIKVGSVSPRQEPEGRVDQRHRRNVDKEEERRGEVADPRLRQPAGERIEQGRDDREHHAQHQVDAPHEPELAQRFHIEPGVKEHGAVAFHARTSYRISSSKA